MNTRTAAFMKAFLQLPANLKTEVVAEINKFYESSDIGKELLNEDVKKTLGSSRIDFGPVGTSCPTCGK